MPHDNACRIIVQTYCRGQGIHCTGDTTEISFDELILRTMRAAGAVK